MKQSFGYSGAVLWNDLPSLVRKTTTQGLGLSNMAVTTFCAPTFLLIFGCLLSSKLAFQLTEDSLNLKAITGNYIIQICTKLRVGSEAFHTSSRTRNLDAILNSNSKLILIFNLLLLCGDISANPGPQWKFLCSVCTKPVKSNQQGICCDHCDKWFHTRCCGMNKSTHDNLENSSCVWICPACESANYTSTVLRSTPTLSISNTYSALDTLTEDSASSSESNEDMESLGSHVQSSTPSRPMSQKPSYRPTTRKTPAKLKAMEINRNSIKGSERAAVFAAHVDLHNPDIIFGCESKLDHDVPTQASLPHGYTIYRKERTLTGGEGIFMAVKSSLPSSELASPHSTTEENDILMGLHTHRTNKRITSLYFLQTAICPFYAS